jgi:hypothetical protein
MGVSNSLQTDNNNNVESGNLLSFVRIIIIIIILFYIDLKETNNNDSIDELVDESLISNNNNNNNRISLKFHDICGKNIQFTNRNRQAERKERTFCDAIVFSSRSIAMYEHVHIRIVKQSTNWHGVFKFGFTYLNPSSLIGGAGGEVNALPKYVYPDMTNRKGCWAASMLESSVHENDVVYFYYTPQGQIHYGINNKYEGIFLDGVEVYSNTTTGQLNELWAIFDIYGNTTEIELIKTNQSIVNNNNNNTTFDSLSSSSTLSAGPSDITLQSLTTTNSLTNSSISGGGGGGSSSMITVVPNLNFRRPAPISPVAIDNDFKLEQLLVTFRRLCVDNHLNETLHSSILEQNTSNNSHSLNDSFDSLKMRNFYSSVPVLFHANNNEQIFSSNYKFISNIHGKTIKISQQNDCLLAYRDENIRNCTQLPTRNAYAFLDKPIDLNQSLCIQVVGVDQKQNELKMSLGIGCTTCQPQMLNPLYDLPDDADDFLDRPEYWIVYKNIFNNIKQASLADELCFKIDKQNGDLDLFINGVLVKKCLFNIDITQKIWFFFDLCGRTNAIRLIPSCSNNTNNNKLEKSTINSNTSTNRPNSALIELYKNQFNIYANTDSMNQTRKESNSSNKDECRICWESPIECVFNTCGHMCVCFNW